MARKKRRKTTGKNNLFKGILEFLGACISGIRTVFPFVLIIMAASLAFLGVRQALYADSNLTVQKIMIEPPQALTIAQLQSLESKLVGKNILKLDLQKIAKNVESDPEIEAARVIRYFPAKLKFEIKRRKIVAALQLKPRGPVGLVSDDAVILEVLPKTDASLLQLEAFDQDIAEPKVGMHIKSPGFLEALRFYRIYQENPLAQREAITKMSLDRLGNVTILLGAGPAIHLGRRPQDRMQALEKLVALLQDENRSKIEYVDLQFDNVIVKRKGSR